MLLLLIALVGAKAVDVDYEACKSGFELDYASFIAKRGMPFQFIEPLLEQACASPIRMTPLRSFSRSSPPSAAQALMPCDVHV
jgi:hypothetical protein